MRTYYLWIDRDYFSEEDNSLAIEASDVSEAIDKFAQKVYPSLFPADSVLVRYPEGHVRRWNVQTNVSFAISRSDLIPRTDGP